MRTARIGILTLSSFVTSSQLSCMTEVLKVKKLSENAQLPLRGTEHAAGFDLFAAVDSVVPKGGKALIMTDISIEIPQYTYARIAPRSGLAWKHFIDTGAGVIDYDYRGNVGVILFNHGIADFEVKKGDRIAQMILERISMASCIEVTELGETERGAGGFGSTGMNALKTMSTDDSSVQPKKARSAQGPGSENVHANLLIFAADIASLLGDSYEHRMREIVLTGDSSEKIALDAVVTEYNTTFDRERLKQSLDIVFQKKTK